MPVVHCSGEVARLPGCLVDIKVSEFTANGETNSHHATFVGLGNDIVVVAFVAATSQLVSTAIHKPLDVGEYLPTVVSFCT